MEKFEFIFIIIEAIAILIEIGLQIYEIVQSKKTEKMLLDKLNKIKRINEKLERNL